MTREMSVLGIYSYQRVWMGGGGVYLDNSKHFIFWLSNRKQLNFRHFNFNTNSNKFFETVNFFQKEAKTA